MTLARGASLDWERAYRSLPVQDASRCRACAARIVRETERKPGNAGLESEIAAGGAPRGVRALQKRARQDDDGRAFRRSAPLGLWASGRKGPAQGRGRLRRPRAAKNRGAGACANSGRILRHALSRSHMRKTGQPRIDARVSICHPATPSRKGRFSRNAPKTLPRRPLRHRPRPVRHEAHQKAQPHRRIQGPPAPRQGGRKGRTQRQQISLRDQQPLDHRRHRAQQPRALFQPLLQSERGSLRRRPPRLHPRLVQHQAGRRDRLPLRHGLPAQRHRHYQLPLLALPQAQDTKSARGTRGARAKKTPAGPRTAQAGALMSDSADELQPSVYRRADHIPLGIALMVGATMLFATSTAISKWQVTHYAFAEVLFIRTAVSLVTCGALILPWSGLAVFRTRRLGGHAARAGTQTAAQSLILIALSLMPIAGAMAINFSAPLFATLFAAL